MAGSPQESDAGFSRCMRLLRGSEFDAVFEQRKRIHGVYFSAHVSANPHGHPRLGITVSRRVSKKAVARNRLKRIIRAAFRHRQHKLDGIDYVVIAKAGAADAMRPALWRELDNILGRARRRCHTR